MSNKNKITIEEYVKGLAEQDRVILAKAITLIESNSAEHFTLAQDLLNRLLEKGGHALRIGITGVPGAGKSTLIDTLGMYLIKMGKKVAVLAIDPSSEKTGGSILGDKTRMENLAGQEAAFIRPSPAKGALGGVARKTRESILLCEAYGFDVILIETMGVGQAESAARAMVDFFILIQIAGAGDELQGIKKGIIEMADAIAINKADGDNIKNAQRAKQELETALHYIGSRNSWWDVPVLTCSAVTGQGIDTIWKSAESYVKKAKQNKQFQAKRITQDNAWMHNLINENIREFVYHNARFNKKIKHFEKLVLSGQLTPTAAAFELIESFKKIFNNNKTT